jgi:hypothetical protein
MSLREGAHLIQLPPSMTLMVLISFHHAAETGS